MTPHSSLSHKLRVARRWSAQDWLVLAQAWWGLLLIDLGLRLLPFQRLQRLSAARIASPPQSPEAIPALIEHLHRLVSIAANHHLYPMTCLRQTLVLQRLLAQRGIVAKLEIGVRKDAGLLAAHAWLEYCGQPIGPLQAVTAYTPLVPASIKDIR